MIERKSLFELIGNNTTKYHSAILTTYTFDPIYFGTCYLGKLRSCGISNIIVMVDSSNYDKVAGDYARYGNMLPFGSYSLVRQQPSSGGVFHPKVSMLIGQKEGLLFAGSGNLTYSGQSVNEEVWGCLWLTDGKSPYLPIFGTVWRYFDAVITKSPLITQQMTWMQEYSDWLKEAVANWSDNIVTEHGEDLYFLFNNDENGIYRQLLNNIGNATVSEVDVVSPFYDEQGVLLKKLKNDLSPKTMRCIVYREGTFPVKLIESYPDDFAEWKSGDGHKDRLHAKIYQFKTDKGTYLLIGSPNATANGWGFNRQYYNDEAALLLHEPSGIDYMKELGISLNNGVFDAKSFKEPQPLKSENVCQYEVVIYSAEIIDGKFYMQTNSSADDLTVTLLNGDGEAVEVFTYKAGTDSFSDGHKGCRLAVITRNGKEISNRCLILSDSAIARCNPNPAGHKLTSLFNSGSHWDDNIAKILEFVAFDLPSEKKKDVKVTVKRSNEIVANDKVIKQEQFDDISSGNRYSVLSMNNVRIVDYLCRFIGNPETPETDDETDVNVTDDERQQGVDEEGAQLTLLIDLRSSEEKDERAIIRYIDKFRHFIGTLLQGYDKDLLDGNSDKRASAKGKPQIGRHQGGLNEYSSALIFIALVYQLLRRSNLYVTNVNKLRNSIVTALGGFLLYYHQEPKDTHDYRYRKICAMYKDLTVFTLLSISKIEMPKGGAYYNDIRLLILNLFDFYYNRKDELKAVYELFEHKLEEENGINADSVKIIRMLYEDFLKFSRNNIQQIGLAWDYAIEWSSANGFAYRDEFKPNPKYPGQFTSRYIPCGCHNCWFKIESGQKLVLFG